MPELSGFRNGAEIRWSRPDFNQGIRKAGARRTLRTSYERFIRNLWLVISNRCLVVQGFQWEAPTGGSNGCDDNHVDAVPGGCRVLCSIPGGSGQGVQDSLDFATGTC